MYVKSEMDKKLTLSLNERIIESAKKYAKNHQTSLSRLIESYLSSLAEDSGKEVEITPLVESLSGVIELPRDFDLKREYADHLMEKHK